MKRFIALALAIMTAATCFCLAGCGGNKIVLATGGNTGTYYSYGLAIGQVLGEKIGTTFDVQSTGASKANIQLIDSGEADIAVVQNDVMYYANTGTDLFAADGKIESFSAMATLYPELVQIIASEKSGIKTVADLKGKRVSVGDAGSGVEFNAKQILAAYDIDMNADIEKQNLSFGASADALKDDKIDAFFCVAGIPTTAVTDLALGNDIVAVSIDDEHFDALSAEYGFYTKQNIPAGTYNGVDADVQTVAVMATFIVSNDMTEDEVYNITKALFESKEEITTAHVKGAELNAETAVDGISIPMHPGAKKYFK